ncbi:putative ORFan [Tupanvirus deep ocean]|uniref:ORFan n=2 Tax=Tupanvirus TaxID=2094720 RepID=A0AC62A6U1_9VIRU|nr:putative ORFan [Tupanvirus deep ocean]QKU33444.1 putative ORFan [Tupanvirus deep ocean]
MQKNKKPTFVGVFAAHGCRTNDGSFVVIPPELSFLTPLCSEGDNLCMNRQVSDFDFTVLDTHEGRKMINTEFFDEKPYEPGFVLKNVSLQFKTIWPMLDLGHTTGIITTGKMHSKMLHLSDFETDTKLRDELMFSHDQNIYPKEELWDKKKNLGDVLRKVVSVGKCGGFFGVFCRGLPEGYVEYVPAFFTISLTKEIYYSNFYSKLEELEKCVTTRDFSEYKLVGLKDSKLKMRVTCDVLCSVIRKKLDFNCTISSFDFHSIVQIYHAKVIPRECVVFSLHLRLEELGKHIRNMTINNVKLSTDIKTPNQKHFKIGLEILCSRFYTTIEKYLDTHPDTMDIVIFVAEKMISEKEISLEFYTKILKYIEIFRIDTEGLVLRFW